MDVEDVESMLEVEEPNVNIGVVCPVVAGVIVVRSLVKVVLVDWSVAVVEDGRLVDGEMKVVFVVVGDWPVVELEDNDGVLVKVVEAVDGIEDLEASVDKEEENAVVEGINDVEGADEAMVEAANDEASVDKDEENAVVEGIDDVEGAEEAMVEAVDGTDDVEAIVDK